MMLFKSIILRKIYNEGVILTSSAAAEHEIRPLLDKHTQVEIFCDESSRSSITSSTLLKEFLLLEHHDNETRNYHIEVRFNAGTDINLPDLTALTSSSSTAGFNDTLLSYLFFLPTLLMFTQAFSLALWPGADGSSPGTTTEAGLLQWIQQQSFMISQQEEQLEPLTYEDIYNALGKYHKVRSSDTQLLDEKCSLCYDEFKIHEGIRHLPCTGRHTFHKRCVDKWFLLGHTTCPLCRDHCINE